MSEGTCTIKTFLGGEAGSREVDLSSLGEKVLHRTLKSALVMYEANRRQGTANTKTRAEVAGSGSKPYRQKGTGRARAGTAKSPIWRGGGVVFGPKPRDYTQKMPRKMKQAALRSALLAKFQDDQVVVVDGLPAENPSTKQAAALLAGAGVDRGALVVVPEVDQAVLKSFRNIPRVEVRRFRDLNAYDVLRRKHLMVTPQVLDMMTAGSPVADGEEN